MGLRELLILILILAIVGVILRGLFVALRARRGQLRIALTKNIPQYDPEDLSLSELPNGGARMIERSFAEVVRQNSEFSSRQPKRKSDHAIPVLMDSVEDEDDEDARATSGATANAASSGVATARQAARQKRLSGSARPRPPQRPTHRPIDRMAARGVGAATATIISTPSAPVTAVNPPVTTAPTPQTTAATRASLRDAELGFDFDYDDPLDSHVFKDSGDDDYAPPASFDDAYDEYADDEQAYEEEASAALNAESADESSNVLNDIPNQEFKDVSDGFSNNALDDESEEERPYHAPRENAAAAWEMDEEEYNEGGLEESIDEAVAEVQGQSRDAVITQAFEEAYADDELEQDDLADDELDPDDDYYDDDEEKDDDHDDHLTDDETESAGDDYYDDEDDDEADDVLSDEEYDDEPVQMAVADYEDDDADDDEYDDDFSDDDYVDEQMDEQKSGPRRWLQWAGDKLASMSAATAEESRAPEPKKHEPRMERAEPTIGGGSFDDVMAESVAPVQSRNAAAPRNNAPIDKSQQSELNLDDHNHDYDHDHDHNHDHDRVGAGRPANHAKSPAPARASAPTYTSEPVPERAPASTWAPAPEPASNSVGAGQPANAPNPSKPAPEPAVTPDYSEVMVFNIFAKPDREFVGVDLLQALLAAGLHFGEMSIFHRHLSSETSSPVVFSVANLVNPGTFDLNRISAFSTKGLCFFMTLPNVANSMQAFDKMLDAAQQIRIALDGDLKDDNRSVMTAQTIEHYRQRVRDFELRQMRLPK